MAGASLYLRNMARDDLIPLEKGKCRPIAAGADIPDVVLGPPIIATAAEPPGQN